MHDQQVSPPKAGGRTARNAVKVGGSGTNGAS